MAARRLNVQDLLFSFPHRRCPGHNKPVNTHFGVEPCPRFSTPASTRLETFDWDLIKSERTSSGCCPMQAWPTS